MHTSNIDVMANYVFTNSMKRHERSERCIKLYNEMFALGEIERVFRILTKSIDEKNKSKNIFKPSKEPVFAIKYGTYKGAAYYLIVDKTKDFDIVFNTSPIDAAYVEFVKVITEEAAIVYTQHALDRYNERIHGDKYVTHRDIIKRFIVNNPIKTDIIFDESSNKIIQRVNEGFLCGKMDDSHSCLVMNTFFDNDDYQDSIGKANARAEFKRLTETSPQQLAKYQEINDQLRTGKISKDEFDFLLYINRIEMK